MRKCLMCRKPVSNEHQICELCEALNIEKCNFHEDMTGYIALITGGRIHIGYHTALRLLRDGATVIATTRFPYDALDRYTKEPDFLVFKDRLHIYQIDLRRVDQIDELANFVKEHFNRLDILINNAAQTIRKSPNYYTALEAHEKECRQLYAGGEKLAVFGTPADLAIVPLENSGLSSYDENPWYNSWVARAEDISIQEFLEVQLINVTAPFFLITKLKPFLRQSEHQNRFIINVSSAEGIFARKRKLSRHAHTNIAKASLNMITNSLSMEYERDHIYMYSVDPGWVTCQFPTAYEASKHFQPYLRFEDGAARICNPIYQYKDCIKIKNAGSFLKNYQEIDFQVPSSE